MAKAQNPAITFNKGRLGQALLKDLYKALLKPRRIEEKMLVLLRQGKVSKWFAGIGQEAISVGLTKALEPDEYILPLHRNLGVFTSRDIPLDRLFKQWQGKLGGFTKGRDRSFHFGTNDYHIVGMISHLGPQMCVADGIALSYKLKAAGKVCAVFTGDGGTSEGDFHEALNVAAVWDLPVIFVIENNGYGLSTPVNEQYRCEQLADRAKGYGIEGITIDGNNILEVYQTMDKLAKSIRKNPRPVLVECMTFRMRGHEEASGVKYVPPHLFDEWQQKDPVENFERYLLSQGIIDAAFITDCKTEIDKEIVDGLASAAEEPAVTAELSKELGDVYAPHEAKPIAPSGNQTEKRLVDAISDGLRQAMEKHDDLVIMGQDVAEYGGVFKITDGFVELFGKERVRNTPICESAILSAGLGISVGGMKSVIEMQFADFVSSGFNAVVNNLAKSHYRWGQAADVVVRMPTGAGVGAGPYHSQTNEAWFFHTPGLKIVFPSNPADAKGLLLAAIENPNPVMFFEHKALYRSINGPVPDDYYTLPIGKAALAAEGEELSIITYGVGVHWALAATEELGIDADIIDLRTLIPLDYEAIETTVRKTGKVLVLHEDTLTGGIGAEISAWITEHLFEYLDGPVMRVASLDTPIPFAANLEAQFLPQKRLLDALQKLADY